MENFRPHGSQGHSSYQGTLQFNSLSGAPSLIVSLSFAEHRQGSTPSSE
jgi:hypothetical protein